MESYRPLNRLSLPNRCPQCARAGLNSKVIKTKIFNSTDVKVRCKNGQVTIILTSKHKLSLIFSFSAPGNSQSSRDRDLP